MGEEKEVKEAECPHVVVEVGLGQEPFFLRADRTIKKNEHYIGLDIPGKTEVSPEVFSALKEKEEFKSKIEGRADLVVASGDKIPMADASVDELIFKNVFSAPSSYFYDAFHKVHERVLQKGGKDFEFVIRREAYEKLRNYASAYADDAIYYAYINKNRVWLEKFKSTPWEKLRKKDKENAKKLADHLESAYAKHLEHIKKMQFVREAERVLRDDGELIIIENSGTAEFAREYTEKIGTYYGSEFDFTYVDTLGPKDNMSKYVKQDRPDMRIPDHWRVYLFTRKPREKTFN